METISKRRVLEEMLEMYNTDKRRFSEGMRNVIPAEGFEKAFYKTAEKAEIVRRMMRELEMQEKEEREHEAVPVLREDAGNDQRDEISMVADENNEDGENIQDQVQQSELHPVSGGADVLPW